MSRLFRCALIGMTMLMVSLCPAHAEVSLVVTGISAIVNNDISKAENSAFEDAFSKAYLELALKDIPMGSSADLIAKLRGFISLRGKQDITQYQIISKTQHENVLLMNVDLTINDAPLKEWLQAQALTTPPGLRPKTLIMIATRGPALNERYEWWSSSTPRGYSPFETQLALRLRNMGENIVDIPRHVPTSPAGSDRLMHLASISGANLIITGTVTHRAIDAITLDSRIDVALIDASTRLRLTTSTITLRGTLDQKSMNDLMISAVIDQIRSEILKKVVVIVPVIKDKWLCIEGIRDYTTYESMINALRSMDTVTRITVERIQGHAICHTIYIKTDLQNILDLLKKRQIAQADMVIEADTASIRLLNQ